MSEIIINNWWENKRKTINELLAKELGYSSPMQPTKLKKIILNSGVSQAINNKQLLDNTFKALQQITGQKPILTNARKSIISFKLREGMPIGCKVTLRKKRAWDFLFMLINICLPRIPSFQGLSREKFDHHGNYNLGIKDLSIFPTVDYSLVFKNQGCQVTLVFSSSSKEENSLFLSFLNFPFFIEKDH